jgi:hypothetical protein
MTATMNIEDGIRSRFFKEMERIIMTHPDYEDVHGGRHGGRCRFAEILKWKNQNLYEAEAGKRGVPLRILHNMAVLYGTDLNWLILGTNKTTNSRAKKVAK